MAGATVRSRVERGEERRREWEMRGGRGSSHKPEALLLLGGELEDEAARLYSRWPSLKGLLSHSEFLSGICITKTKAKGQGLK